VDSPFNEAGGFEYKELEIPEISMVLPSQWAYLSGFNLER